MQKCKTFVEIASVPCVSVAEQLLFAASSSCPVRREQEMADLAGRLLQYLAQRGFCTYCHCVGVAWLQGCGSDWVQGLITSFVINITIILQINIDPIEVKDTLNFPPPPPRKIFLVPTSGFICHLLTGFRCRRWYYDRRSVGQSVLVSGTSLGHDYWSETPSLKGGRVCSSQCSHSLVRLVHNT
jgi:hypothetical protein